MAPGVVSSPAFMTRYESLVLFALAGSGGASLLAYILADRFLPSLPWLQAIGRKMHDQKMAMLDKPPLRQYKQALDRGHFKSGFSIIAALILLKSIGSGVLGLITVIYLPFGVGTIPALAAEHGDQPGLRTWVAQVTAWQLASHLLAACIGFAATWLWFSDGIAPAESMVQSPVLTATFVGGSLLTGLVAAWIETAGHFRKGYF